MEFVERARDESAVAHLLRNADALCLGDDQRERLLLAYRLEVGTNADRVAARQIAYDVQAELKADLDAVIAQAKVRSEGVAKFNDAGALRIKGRDGFGALHDSGSFSDVEFSVGMAYRYLFEQRCSSLGSQLDRAGGGGAGVNGAPASGLLRAYTTMRLTKVEAAVNVFDLSGHSLELLRLVVGEGHSLSAIVSKGGQRRRAVASLHSALGVVLGVFTRDGMVFMQHLRIGVT